MTSDLFPQQGHDPGGKRMFPLPLGTVGDALFDGPGDCYRYLLSRVWDKTLPSMLACMMNPSTAAANGDDPTVAKIGRYARRWGYGRLWVWNVYAYRCTNQRRLIEVDDPVGPDNDNWLGVVAPTADLVLMAYGSPSIKPLRARGKDVSRRLIERGIKLHVLQLSQDGVPVHPLYLPMILTPRPWDGPWDVSHE